MESAVKKIHTYYFEGQPPTSLSVSYARLKRKQPPQTSLSNQKHYSQPDQLQGTIARIYFQIRQWKEGSNLRATDWRGTVKSNNFIPVILT